MSLLPQRKKSPEEIAKLRESLGIPGVDLESLQTSPEAATRATAAVETLTPTHHEAIVVAESITPPITAPMPAPVHHGPKPVHSLKRSERIPALPMDDSPAPKEVIPTADPPIVLKTVRSLRKSEQGPVLVPAPKETAAESKLPVHRHSDQELSEIRRREALAALQAAEPNPRLAVAHPGILAPGYLFSLCGLLPLAYDLYQNFSTEGRDKIALAPSLPVAVPAACAAVALLIAAFILLRRPISRHHGAFIAVITLFVIVFGALHYFPQLLHAT